MTGDARHNSHSVTQCHSRSHTASADWQRTQYYFTYFYATMQAYKHRSIGQEYTTRKPCLQWPARLVPVTFKNWPVWLLLLLLLLNTFKKTRLKSARRRIAGERGAQCLTSTFFSKFMAASNGLIPVHSKVRYFRWFSVHRMYNLNKHISKCIKVHHSFQLFQLK